MMVQYDVKRVSKGTENFMVSFDFTKTPITQVADYIIIAASKNKASDIHFDPREDGMMVRFRIDGDCQDYTHIPKAYEKNLSTRLKLLANMNITETRLPQDGAIKGQFGDTYLDMRVACLPTNQGEKIVIRILDYTRSLQGIESLGFHPQNLEKIKHMMSVPNGIILVTGATGSGKSTTTYSMISALNKPEVNVITVEDPVEMNIEGVNQVQVNADIGMTFAAALRSILREDPNVILIGEIRDSETAQIAVRASITGHLVMSTLHTNNALATVERLLDMDVERYLLSTALTGIISQRLAKQLCPDCRYQRETTKYEKKVFKNFLHKNVDVIWDANPKGCENCRKGYRGRLAFHEVLLLDDHIRNALNDEKMVKEDFAKMIYGGNTISMLQDALVKVLEGQTSFEEVYRTIEIENEDEDNYEEEISGITGNTEEEEKPVETTTDDMFDDMITTTSTSLTESIEVPGITTTETEPTKEVQSTEQITIPGVEVVPPNESSQEQTEVLVDSPKEENTLGYKIVMPDENPKQEEQSQEIQPVEEPQPTPEEQSQEPIQEDYTITGVQGGLDGNEKETIIINKPEESIQQNEEETHQVVNKESSEKKEEAEERKYDSSFYSDEEPIEPEIEIRSTNILETQVPQLEKLDSTKEEETYSLPNLETQPNEISTDTAIIPNIQAISVIPSLSEETQKMHTASEILMGPGIRIAEPSIPSVTADGTVNRPAEINAEPILPNIE